VIDERETMETAGEGGDRGRDAPDRAGHLGFVAHEVRNPLSTALWTAELLVRMTSEERAGPRGEKLAAMCLRSLGRVRQLVEDHFLVERLDAGGLPTRPEPVLLRDAVDEVVTRGAPVASSEVDGRAAVFADRNLVERAIDALVRAAGRDGAAVRLEAAADGDVVRVRVAGAPPLPDALADPRKGSPSDTKNSALGLSAARRIAATAGGRLAVEGDAFVLTLPRLASYTPPPGDGSR
jgi:signal transduction histidine kinase